ncbi:putative Acid phosphatase [Helianthus debilis subsp. tardiflorus]
MGVRWDTYGRFAERIQAYNPWISTAGNHEIEYMPYMDEVDPFKQYLYRYPTPYAASESSSPLWYAVRRASAHIIVLSSYSPFVKYTPQYKWLKAEFKKVNRWKTPWLIVVMHVPIYSSNSAHYMEGESMRAAFESWFVKYKVDVVFAGHVHAYERSHRISNIEYDVTGGVSCPVPDKSAPIYITIGDGGNQEGLASSFNDPQPDYSAFREASYGHSTLELINKTHAFYHWNRNDDGKKVATDSFVLRNQYWKKRKLEENDLHSITPTPELDAY